MSDTSRTITVTLSNKAHELAKEYVLNTFDFNKSPRDFAEAYLNASSEITEALKDKRKNKPCTVKATARIF